MAQQTITSFENLTVWQHAQDLAVAIYKTTRDFPKEEMFAMTSQLRRAAYSVSANIAEGFGRKTKSDKLHFYTMAYGSLLELKNFLYLAHRLQYVEKQTLDETIESITSCQKLLNAFKAGLR
ncbi:MAG: four helix bundle protein [Candidatus Saccharimonadales bacterium]